MKFLDSIVGLVLWGTILCIAEYAIPGSVDSTTAFISTAIVVAGVLASGDN